MIVCDPLSHLVAGSMISTIRFANHLRARGHKVIFAEAKNKSKEDKIIWKGFKVYKFFSFFLPGSDGQYPLAFATKKRIRRILYEEKIDIVHAIDPTPLSIAFIKVANELGIKNLIHAHLQPENIAFGIPKILNSERFKKLVYKYMIWIYRKTAMVISPSKFGKELLNQHDRNLKIHVISNGVSLERFKVLSNGRSKNGNLLFVGRLAGEKSVDTIIKAMPLVIKKHPEVKLDIVGCGPLSKKLHTLAMELEIGRSINFHGRVTSAKLLALYQMADIFVLPSVAELEGIVVLEAMACGKPIIISDSKDSAATHFVDGNGLTFKLGNHHDLASKISFLLQNEIIRQKMGQRSSKNVRQYDIRASVDKLEKLYNSLRCKT